MMSRLAVLLLVALAGNSALADQPLGFIKDVQGAQRIVSGWETQPGQIPHQLSLKMVDSVGEVTSCGGSIIHKEWGLTGADCTATRKTIIIRAGAVKLSHPELIFEATEWYNHPEFDDTNLVEAQPNDVALIKFPRQLPFSKNIQPIRLQSSVDRNRNYDGVRLTASGWGTLSTNGVYPMNMNWVYLLGVSNEACRSVDQDPTIIVDSTLCAGPYTVSSQSICSGDGGGPLTVVDDDGQLSQVGIASFRGGDTCEDPHPAGFVRPGHYHDWFLEVTGINFDWKPTSSS